MLKGSTSEKIQRWRLNELSTFGILSHFTLAELTRLIDVLAAAGFVECPEVDRFRPIVNLTDTGWAVLKTHDLPIALDLPPDLAAKVRNGGLERVASRPAPVAEPAAGGEIEDESASPVDDPLFQTLRELRTGWAREARTPAYCVFTNETLDALVRTRPTTPQALAAVKGLAQARIERYGAALLEAIRNGLAPSSEEPGTARDAVPLFREPVQAAPPSAPAASPVPPAPPPARTATSFVPTEEWTWRLIERGFSLDDAAAIRGLERNAIIRHLTLAARQGKSVRPETIFAPETLRRWDAWRTDHGDAAAPPDDPGPDALWTLFIACRRPP
jgi:ATP-dependent DNA helicase RecQ